MRPWIANVLGLGVGGLVVGAGLVLSAPDASANGPSHPQTLGALPAGDSAAEIPLGDNLQLMGRPARLGVFWTSDSTEKVAQTYMDAWSSFQLPPHVIAIDKVTSVTAVDTSEGPGTGLMRSVTIIDQGDTRMVVPGLSDTSQPLDFTPRKAPVPVPDTAVAYSATSADDGGSVSYSGTYMVPLSASRVIDFYEKELGKDSYKVSKARKKVNGGAIIEFERGPEWISVIARDKDLGHDAKSKGLASADVMITHVRTLQAKPEWKP